MQISKVKLNPVIKRQVMDMWCQMIADIKDPKEALLIFEDLFSEIELAAITKRLAVGYWLTNKRSYDVIKSALKVSSATIATVAADLKKPGWKTAIEKVMAEEWATKWEAKIFNLFKYRVKVNRVRRY